MSLDSEKKHICDTQLLITPEVIMRTFGPRQVWPTLDLHICPQIMCVGCTTLWLFWPVGRGSPRWYLATKLFPIPLSFFTYSRCALAELKNKGGNTTTECQHAWVQTRKGQAGRRIKTRPPLPCEASRTWSEEQKKKCRISGLDFVHLCLQYFAS